MLPNHLWSNFEVSYIFGSIDNVTQSDAAKEKKKEKEKKKKERKKEEWKKKKENKERKEKRGGERERKKIEQIFPYLSIPKLYNWRLGGNMV